MLREQQKTVGSCCGRRDYTTLLKRPARTGLARGTVVLLRRFRVRIDGSAVTVPITDLTEALISIILNLRNLHSGEDYPKRLSLVLVSEFLVGELIKRSSYLKLKSMRNSFRTRQPYFRNDISKFPAVFELVECDSHLSVHLYEFIVSHDRISW